VDEAVSSMRSQGDRSRQASHRVLQQGVGRLEGGQMTS
jgi:hypothetical protein